MQVDSATGDLVVTLPVTDTTVVQDMPTIREHAPQAWQLINGQRVVVPVQYQQGADGSIQFALGAYDATQPLTIDPTLTYTTYLGGSSSDRGWGVAVDSSGAIYVAGQTFSSNFPSVTGHYDSSLAGTSDAFVTKFIFSTSGSSYVYSTYIGGNGDDIAFGVGIDNSGNAYIAGSTTSTNFPVTTGRTTNNGPSDAFAVSLNSSGNARNYSFYIGGSGDDIAGNMDVDSAGNIYLAGFTTSTDFVTKNPYQAQNNGGMDVFISKYDATGAKSYATYYGGSGDDYGYAIAFDGSGNAYVAGSTTSTDLPGMTGALQGANQGGTDVFALRLSTGGGSVQHATYLGGTSTESAYGITVDSANNPTIAGYSYSTSFPTFGISRTTNASTEDVFVARLTSTWGSLSYLKFLGGNGDDWGSAIAGTSNGTVVVTGIVSSTDMLTVNPVQTANAGSADVFVSKLNASGTVLYQSYLGGSGYDAGYGVAVDSNGTAYLTGETYSSNFPHKYSLDSTLSGTRDAFVSVIDDPTNAPIPTSTPTSSPTATGTATNTPTRTLSPTRTNTATQTETATTTATRTSTSTNTPTRTLSPTRTDTATQTGTATTTATRTSTTTNTPTRTGTATQTGTPTGTATNTSVAVSTNTATSTATRTSTVTMTPTSTSTSVFSCLSSTATGVPATATSTASTTATASPQSSTRIKTITFENTSLTDPTTGVDAVVGTVQRDTSAPLKGVASARIPNVDNSYVREDFTGVDELYTTFYLQVVSLPTTSVRIAQVRNGTTTVGELLLLTNGKLRLRDNGTTIGTDSATTLAPGSVYRIGLHQKRAASTSTHDGVLEGFVALGEAAFGSPFAASTTETFTSQATRVQVGSTVSGNFLDALFDDLVLDSGAMPQPSGGLTPTATATPNATSRPTCVATSTPTNTPTNTPTDTATATATDTATPTYTDTPTDTTTPTDTATPTSTNTVPPTATDTVVPTDTPPVDAYPAPETETPQGTVVIGIADGAYKEYLPVVMKNRPIPKPSPTPTSSPTPQLPPAPPAPRPVYSYYMKYTTGQQAYTLGHQLGESDKNTDGTQRSIVVLMFGEPAYDSTNNR